MLTRQHFLHCLAASTGTLAIGGRPEVRAAEASGGSPFPLQLEVRAPFGPAAFPSVGGAYAVYELHLTNFSGGPITLHRIEIVDAAGAGSKQVAIFEGAKLYEILQPVGAPPPKEASGQIAAGGTSVAYLWLPFANMESVPSRLRHTVVTSDNSVEGAIVDTRSPRLAVLAAPVRGAGWKVSNGPSNGRGNHHRRGILALDGRIVISRRFAIDWFLHKNGQSRLGDVHRLESYHSYGEAIFAVDDATVLIARDGQLDNVPGPVESFRTVVPITMDTVAGNQIMLDLGGGQFAWYCHLQPGSVQVKCGDRVRRGQPLARIGCSGDANLPHLHFEVTTSSKLLAGEGLPYLIDKYRVWTAGNVWQARSRELPLDQMLIEFG